ncbi:DUF5707 domain-containing protein [Streptomyces sp. NBC_01754]|uniref:DUF5707 domain-containing protein n=1 Tax=Streptomyces sp. NBC_01754 TaxID=2975930 RepID=UPI002DDA09F5|nr:DUF5707 domain-containing protein [Streptomyces sp. NBC_01754]WSC96431.1 DUF5707 domain-containing protein [Streptomyces sp. NBC_01754]
MSRRVLISSLIGATVIGGVAAGGLATASARTEPTVKNGSARYTAPSGGTTGSFTFTVDVSDDSGVRGLKVIAWPASSKLNPTEEELRHAEDATCRSTTEETSRCTYTLKVTKEEAAGLERGTWYVSALATAKDGGTVFVPRAATFDVPR